MKTLSLLATVLLTSCLVPETGWPADKMPTCTPKSVLSPPPAPTPADNPPLQVTGVRRVRGRNGDDGPLDRAGLKDTIEVTVHNLSKWYAVKANQAKQFTLVIDGRVFTGHRSGPQTRPDTLQFVLTYDKGPWSEILGRPTWSYRCVALTVAYPDSGAFVEASSPNFAVSVIPVALFFWCLGIFLAFLILFLVMARSSNIVRDGSPDHDVLTAAGKRPPFSLGRTQMSVWFFAIFASFILIWVITGNPNTVHGSLLALLGVSAATALGSVAVERTRREGTQERLKETEAQETQLRARVTALRAESAGIEQRLAQAGLDAAEAANLAGQRTVKEAEITATQTLLDRAAAARTQLVGALAPHGSRGIITDLISDDRGVSLHRFQIAAWTTILLVVFGKSVWETLAMPTFDTTVVTLMGISSGTYVGFKIAEKS
jgi:hypothetical protein